MLTIDQIDAIASGVVARTVEPRYREQVVSVLKDDFLRRTDASIELLTCTPRSIAAHFEVVARAFVRRHPEMQLGASSAN